MRRSGGSGRSGLGFRGRWDASHRLGHEEWSDPRKGQESLRSRVEKPNLRQVRGLAVGQDAGKPLGKELLVEVVQRLDLEERVQQADQLFGDPLGEAVVNVGLE